MNQGGKAAVQGLGGGGAKQTVPGPNNNQEQANKTKAQQEFANKVINKAKKNIPKVKKKVKNVIKKGKSKVKKTVKNIKKKMSRYI